MVWFCFVLKMIFTDSKYETQYHLLFKSGEKVLCSERSQRQPEKARVLNSAFCEKWDLQGQSGGRGSFQIGSLDERLGTGHGEADCQEVSVSKGQRQYIIKVRVGLVDGGIP